MQAGWNMGAVLGGLGLAIAVAGRLLPKQPRVRSHDAMYWPKRPAAAPNPG